MKSAIPKPVGSAADCHREKDRSGGRSMERTTIPTDETKYSPRYQRRSEPVAHGCWRSAASFLVLRHNLDSHFRRGPSLAVRVTSPRQHLPEGFFTSQAQLPAFTSAVIRSATVECPVSAISS